MSIFHFNCIEYLLQVICNPVYSAIYDIAKRILPDYNIEVTFVQSGCSVSEYEKNIKPNTKVI